MWAEKLSSANGSHVFVTIQCHLSKGDAAKYMKVLFLNLAMYLVGFEP